MGEIKASEEMPATIRGGFIFVMALSFIGLVIGWRVFWVLTDDVFVAFRYVSNAHKGYGYVWNAPSFLPVEGYASFLWVAVLDIFWRVTLVEPPDSANLISLFLSFGTLVICAAMIMRMDWLGGLKRHRLIFVLTYVVFLLFNRTFLA